MAASVPALNSGTTAHGPDLDRLKRRPLRRLEPGVGADVADDEPPAGAEVVVIQAPRSPSWRSSSGKAGTPLVPRRDQPVAVRGVGVERAIDAEAFASSRPQTCPDLGRVGQRPQGVADASRNACRSSLSRSATSARAAVGDVDGHPDDEAPPVPQRRRGAGAEAPVPLGAVAGADGELHVERLPVAPEQLVHVRPDGVGPRAVRPGQPGVERRHVGQGVAGQLGPGAAELAAPARPRPA